MADAFDRLAEDQRIESLDEVPSIYEEEEEQEIVKQLKYHLDTFKADVTNLHQTLPHWHRLYEGKRLAEKTFPWPGASAYSVPIIMATIDSLHARIVKAVFEVDPLWVARAYVPQAHETAKKAEWYLDTWADAMGLPQVLDAVAFNMLVEGTGIAKFDWVREKRKVPSAPVQSPDGMVGSTPTEVVEYEGPRGYAVPLRDFVILPADAPTLDEAVYVGHRVYLTEQELRKRQQDGVYFNVPKLLEKGPGGSLKDSVSGDYDTGFGVTAGGELTVNTSLVTPTRVSSSAHPETNQYEIYELYGPHVFDEEVGPEAALFTFSDEHSILLRLEPYPYKYGRAPYVDFCVFPRPNSFWGRSVAEMLESAQAELTALHNMRGDSIAIQVAPPILHRQGGLWNPEEQPWRPGQVIPVTDPAELVQMNLKDIPSSLFAHERDIMEFTERMTGMSDVFMGRVGSPYQTATATTAARSEGLVRLDVSISRFLQGMKRVAWILWWMLFQYRPYLDKFHVSETNTDYDITKPEMAPGANGLMPFEFLPQGTQSDASKEARRQQLIFLLNTLFPILQQNYPDGLQILLKEMLHSFDIKNKSDILGPPWALLQQQLQQAFAAGVQQGQQAAQQEPVQ